MIDDLAYLIAQQRTAARAREALPGSPVLPDDQNKTLRHRGSVVLRRLADWLEPRPPAGATAVAECR